MTVTSFMLILVAWGVASQLGIALARKSMRKNPAVVRGICPTKTPPLATKGNSCGIPDFVDAAVFGDNANTMGRMTMVSGKDGLSLDIRVFNLPRSDLVLTAWLVWVPFGVMKPKIFEISNHASPCAPYTAAFGSGLGPEPNSLTYSGVRRASLRTKLNFNPTYPGEGALTRETFSYQYEVPGIEKTKYRQYKTPGGVYIPTSSAYLRQYDEKTGFEKLDRNGLPLVVRSPVKALGVEIIAHVDRTTHGISQGVGGVDHYFVLFFPFNKPFGRPTQ